MVIKQVTVENLDSLNFRSMLFWMVTKHKLARHSCWWNFRSMLFWMVTKPEWCQCVNTLYFRSMLFWMVTKHIHCFNRRCINFRSMLFWMVTKPWISKCIYLYYFRSMLFWMVTKLLKEYKDLKFRITWMVHLNRCLFRIMKVIMQMNWQSGYMITALTE